MSRIFSLANAPANAPASSPANAPTISLTRSAIATVLLMGIGSVTSAPAIAQITGQPTGLGQPASQPASQPITQPPVQAAPIQAAPVQAAPLAANSTSNATYMLGAGDQISLSVIGYPEFTGTLAILSDGTITLPLVGPLRVSGLTPNQLSTALTQRLRTYLVDPVVSVGLSAMRPVVVTVSGEVYRPGPIQLSSLSSNNGDPLGSAGTTSAGGNALTQERPALPTLSSAVLLAGGVTRDADIRQVLVRRPLPGGRVETLSLNLWESITSDVGVADIGLRDGDSIFIPRLSGDEIDRRRVASSSLAPSTVRVKVVGEVVSPGEVAVPPDSSVSSAVAIAGGPTEDAQLKRVSLVRQDDTGEIVEQEIDLRNLVDSYQVQDGDVVVVAKRGYLSVVDGIGRVINPVNWFRILGF